MEETEWKKERALLDFQKKLTAWPGQYRSIFLRKKKREKDRYALNNLKQQPLKDDHPNETEEILDGEDDDDVTHFQEFNDDNDDCPDLEEIGNEKDDEDHDTYNRSDNDSYGEKTIDEKDMEKYFNGKLLLQYTI